MCSGKALTDHPEHGSQRDHFFLGAGFWDAGFAVSGLAGAGLGASGLVAAGFFFSGIAVHLPPFIVKIQLDIGAAR